MGRPKKTTNPSLGVDWHLPATRGPGYAKRRFTTTTQSSADLIADLAADGSTWGQIAKAIAFDDDALAVAQRFVAEGFGDEAALLHLRTAP